MLGPVFSVELLMTSRRARYYVVRFVYAIALVFILCINYAENFYVGGPISIRNLDRFGQHFFYGLAIVQLITAVVVVAAVTAGTIAEERERRTIEYLFATDLTSVELILGKLASRLLHMISLLAAGVPILCTTLLFGGVDAEDLLEISVITLSTMVFTACVSICLSIWSTRPSSAILRAFVVFFGLFALPWLSVFLAIFLTLWGPNILPWIAPVMSELAACDPFLFLFCKSIGGRTPPGLILSGGWTAVLEMARNQTIASLVMIALAVWRVRKVHLRTASQPRQYGASGWNLRLWRPALGNRPMLWKEFFAERAVQDMGRVGQLVVVVLFLVILIPLGRTFYRCYTGQLPRDSFQEVATIMSLIVGSAFLLIIGARAASSVTLEKEKQCWEVLMSTTLTPFEIVVAKTLGSLYALRWIIGILAIVWGLATMLLPHSFLPGILTTLTVGLLSLFFASAGVFLSLRSRNSTWAMCGSLLVSVFLSGGYWLLFLPWLGGATFFSDHKMLLAPCAPWLVAWPGWYELQVQPHWKDAPLSVYLVGMSLYGVATALVFLINVRYLGWCMGTSAKRSVRRERPLESPTLPAVEIEHEPTFASQPVKL